MVLAWGWMNALVMLVTVCLLGLLMGSVRTDIMDQFKGF